MNIYRLTTLLALAFCSVVASAQPLDQRIPPGADLIIVWRGFDADSDAYRNSNLKAMLDDTRLDTWIRTTWVDTVTGFSELGNMSAQDQARWDEINNYFSKLSDRPWSCFLDIDKLIQEEFTNAFGLIIENPTPAHLATLQELVDEFNEEADEFTLTLTSLKDCAVIAPAGSNTQPAPHPTFARGLQVVGDDCRYLFHLTTDNLPDWIALVRKYDDKPTTEFDLKVQDLVVDVFQSVNAVTIGANHQGQNWRTHCFIDLPEQRTGYLSWLNGPELNPELLRKVPDTSDCVTVFSLDLHQAYENTIEAVTRVFPKAEQQTQAVRSMILMATTIDPIEGLINPLGPDWLGYLDVHGNAGEGVLINHARDVDALFDAIGQLAELANALLASQENMPFRIHDGEQEGMKFYTAGVVLFAPTVAFKDDYVLLATDPMVALSASRHLDKDTTKWFDLYQKQHTRPLHSWTYYDLEKRAAGNYQTMISTFQSLTMTLNPSTKPVSIPGTASDIQPHLAPATSISWTDDLGWHMQTDEPFPGATIFATQFDAQDLSVSSTLVGVMLPALGAARRTARQIQALNQTRQLSIAMFAYTFEHNDKLPTRLSDCYTSGYISLDAFDHPENPIPANIRQQAARNPNAPEVIDWIDHRSQYRLIQHGYTKLSEIPNPSRFILIVETPSNPTEQPNVAVGFADGHAERLTTEQVSEMLQQQPRNNRTR